MTSAEQLARTISLFEIDFGVANRTAILRALTQPRVTIVADERVVRTLSGQVAISTAAMLMARTGHQVYVDTPDAILIGYQPPLSGSRFLKALSAVGGKLIDGVPITIGASGVSDIVFCLGVDPPWMPWPAARYVSVGASDWEARFCDAPRRETWSATDWPMGGLAAGVLMAAEAVKITARALAPLSPDAGAMCSQFADLPTTRLTLAPTNTPLVRDVGIFDIISAGAVSNATLYALLRIPGLNGGCRAFDKDISEAANLNRNMLLTTSYLGQPKVALFASLSTDRFCIDPVAEHYPLDGSVDLHDHVIVGVDDLPARWALARKAPLWMGVGATDVISSMASVHYAHAACGGCLHPKDEPGNGPIPTIAFNSFLAGLMVAADFLVDVSGCGVSLASSQRFITALNPGAPFIARVHPNIDCPAGCPASKLLAA